MMMWWGYNGMGGWGYVLMTLSMLVFWGLLITAVVMTVRYLTRNARTGPDSSQPTAEDVLAQRFARGEIDAEEYHSRLGTLRGGHGTPAGT